MKRVLKIKVEEIVSVVLDAPRLHREHFTALDMMGSPAIR